MVRYAGEGEGVISYNQALRNKIAFSFILNNNKIDM